MTKTYELSDVFEPALSYIERCFSILTDDKNFLEIDFAKVRKILKSSQLNVDFELEVYRFAEEWLKHDVGGRKRHAKDLLRLVRLRLFSQKTLERLLVEPSPFTEADECRAVLERAAVKEEARQSKTRTVTTLFGRTVEWQILETFNPRAEVRHCGQASFHVLVLGGRQAGSGAQVRSVNRVHAPRIIKSLAPMMTRRSDLKAVLVKGEIFVLGGSGTDVKRNFVEKYSPVAGGRWEKVAGMPDARENYCACAFMRKIYVFGGDGQEGSTRSVVELDTAKRSGKKWRQAAEMGDYRSHAACCVFQGRMVVTGGTDVGDDMCDGFSSCDCFDVSPDGELTWWPMPKMLVQLDSHRLIFFLLKLHWKSNCGREEFISVVKNLCPSFDIFF